MINLFGQPGELRFTLEITRKDTGKVETVEMVGKISEDELTKEAENGSNPLDSGS
jgi:hypothetical protein